MITTHKSIRADVAVRTARAGFTLMEVLLVLVILVVLASLAVTDLPRHAGARAEGRRQGQGRRDHHAHRHLPDAHPDVPGDRSRT